MIGTFLRSKLGVVLLVVALLAGVFLVINTGGFFDGWNTTGERQSAKGYSFGVFLSDTQYATSVTDSGNSEDISVQGAIAKPAWVTFALPNWIKYIAYVEGQEAMESPEFNAVSSGPFPGGFPVIPSGYYPQQMYTFHVVGSVTARLKVVMLVNIVDIGGNYEGERGWDGAYLKSGRGEIQLYGDQGPFEEGRSARVYVSTGFTHGQSWPVKLYPPLDRSDLQVKTIATLGEDVKTYVTIPIESGYFRAGTSNLFTVELWNDLFDVGFCQIFAVDDLGRVPGKPTITITENDGRVSAKVDIESQSTYAEMEQYRVWAWYGTNTMPSQADTESWLLYGQYVPATGSNGNYSGSFNLQIKTFKDGMVHIKVAAIDVNGRASEPCFGEIEVIGGKIGDYASNTELSQPWLWTTLVYLSIVVTILVAAFAGYMLRKRERTAILVVALVVILGAIVTYIVGATPSLALLLG